MVNNVLIRLDMRFRFAVLVSALLSLAACSEASMDFPVDTEAVHKRANQVLPNVQVISITPATLPSGDDRSEIVSYPPLPAISWAYRVGVGDALRIILWEEPMHAEPAGSVAASTPPSSYRVQSDGSFFFPFVGRVDAAGKSAEDIRLLLTERMGSIVRNPQIQVEVAEYHSQSVAVTGEVQSPTNVFLGDAPIRVLDAINMAGGFSETADQRLVTVRRNGKIYGANISEFLTSRQAVVNGILTNGDVVTVGPKAVRQAFLLGGFSKPEPITLGEQEVSLTEAISSAGGLVDEMADARGVFVFRVTPGGFTVYQLDASNPASLTLATRFALRDRDVIYVTTAPLHRWNRVVSGILPTITVVASANDAAVN